MTSGGRANSSRLVVQVEWNMNHENISSSYDVQENLFIVLLSPSLPAISTWTCLDHLFDALVGSFSDANLVAPRNEHHMTWLAG